VVGQHKDREVERGFVPPPAVPSRAAPRPRSSAEHVATHDNRSEVLVFGEQLGARIGHPALQSCLRAPDRQLTHLAVEEFSPTPSGCLGLWFGPVTNPSNDIDTLYFNLELHPRRRSQSRRHLKVARPSPMGEYIGL
jgi:hypothetical protein